MEGDIVAADVDAIVNAANSTLLGGGGVDGAIHRAAGPGLLMECRTLGGCPTGQARITGGHRLKARWVVHAVGPIWRGGDSGEDEALASAYRASLMLAEDVGATTMALPLISTGAYGFPMARACRIAVRETDRFLSEGARLERVVIVCFGAQALDTCLRAVSDL